MYELMNGIQIMPFKTRGSLERYLAEKHFLKDADLHKSLGVLNGKWDGYEYRIVINGSGYVIKIKKYGGRK